jgi:hypothetical protein
MMLGFVPQPNLLNILKFVSENHLKVMEIEPDDHCYTQLNTLKLHYYLVIGFNSSKSSTIPIH